MKIWRFFKISYYVELLESAEYSLSEVLEDLSELPAEHSNYIVIALNTALVSCLLGLLGSSANAILFPLALISFINTYFFLANRKKYQLLRTQERIVMPGGISLPSHSTMLSPNMTKARFVAPQGRFNRSSMAIRSFWQGFGRGLKLLARDVTWRSASSTSAASASHVTQEQEHIQAGIPSASSPVVPLPPSESIDSVAHTASATSAPSSPQFPIPENNVKYDSHLSLRFSNIYVWQPSPLSTQVFCFFSPIQVLLVLIAKLRLDLMEGDQIEIRFYVILAAAGIAFLLHIVFNLFMGRERDQRIVYSEAVWEQMRAQSLLSSSTSPSIIQQPSIFTSAPPPVVSQPQQQQQPQVIAQKEEHQEQVAKPSASAATPIQPRLLFEDAPVSGTKTVNGKPQQQQVEFVLVEKKKQSEPEPEVSVKPAVVDNPFQKSRRRTLVTIPRQDD